MGQQLQHTGSTIIFIEGPLIYEPPASLGNHIILLISC